MLHATLHILRKSLPVLWLLVALGDCSPSPAQDGGFKDVFGMKGGRGGGKQLVDFSVNLTPGEREGEVLLRIKARIPPEHYIYSTNDNGGAETIIEIKSAEGLEAIDETFQADHVPKVENNRSSLGDDDPDAPATIEKYLNRVTWTQRYQLIPGVEPADVSIAGLIRYQICREKECRPNQKHPFSATLAAAESAPASDDEADVEPLAPPRATPTDGDNLPPARALKPGEVLADPVAPAAVNEDDADAAPAGAAGRDKGLVWFLLTAVGAGFAALLTPCSFPMVPITVSFFHKQAEKQNRLPIAMALVYCGGIVAAFTVLGIVMSALFGPAFLTQLANNPWMNTALALLLVFFALNLLGLFEIRVPGWLLTYSATQEGRGGYLGVLFMALTFTLTSFTCTFAFVGGLLVEAAAGDRLWPAIGLFAFSAAFSLPFFFLALFPGLLQKLPRSGNWMNAVKVIMGLVELGAAFKFFSVADLGWNPQPMLFDFELVLSAWMIISIAAALYLLGLFRLPHDMPSEHVGVLRFVTALSFMGLAAYLAVGLYSDAKPAGQVWGKIAAWAPPKLEGVTEPFGPAREHGGIKFALDFQQAVKFAAEKNKPLFIDFTGVNCANCREMEDGPLSKPQVVERLKNFVCVQVFADRVPVIQDKAERARLLEFNINLQTSWFGDTSLPSYAVIPPDPEIATRKAGENLLARSSYNLDEDAFARFLDRGFLRWKQHLANRGDGRVVGRR